MIRRETSQADGSPAWLLISQIEHARISAELAAHCSASIGTSIERAESSSTPANSTGHALCDEVLAAILHHDDGWAEWERAPRLDPALGRPLSFTELEAAEAVAIWDKSIDAASAIGPLAASMVAGHFLRLLRHSNHLRNDAPCAAWQQRTTVRRDQWLAEWRSLDPDAHLPAVSEQALSWLWTFDEISLWFCLSCPTVGESSRRAPALYVAGRGTELEMQLHASASPAPEATARPWRFDASSVDLSAVGQIVAATPYASSEDLLAAARPCRLDWRFSGEV